MRYAAQSRTFILVARKLCQSQTTLRGTFLFASVHNFDALTDPDSFACFGTAALLAVQTKSFHVSRASSEMKRRLSPITRVFFPPVYLSEPWKLWRGRKNLILLPRNVKVSLNGLLRSVLDEITQQVTSLRRLFDRRGPWVHDLQRECDEARSESCHSAPSALAEPPRGTN